MPIYEYLCADCSRHFELLVRGETVPRCPACNSATVERQLSVFAVGGTPRHSAEPQPCGRCGDPRGPGACSLS